MLEYATLGQMAEQIGRQIQDTSADKAVAIKENLNTHYGQLARGHRWAELLRVSEERTSVVSGQKYMYLPKEVEQVYLLFPQGGMPPLVGMTLTQMIEQYSTTYATSGLTLNFAEAGDVGYRTDFYTAGETIKITHSGSGTIEVVVRGIVGGAEGVSTGTEITEVVSVVEGATGGTTTNTFTDLGAVSTAELADGDVVTVVGVTSAYTYAQIAAGERTARYKRIRLMQPPNAAATVTMVWKKRVARLREDNQAVEIPVGNVLIDLCVATMLSNQREYGGAQLHYQRGSVAAEELKAADAIDTAVVVQAIPGTSLRRGYRSGGGY